MDKPNVLIMSKEFTDVSREPIEMLVKAGMQVHEPSDISAESISAERFCELIQGMDVLVVTGSFPVSRQVIESADCLSGRIPPDVLTPGVRLPLEAVLPAPA